MSHADDPFGGDGRSQNAEAASWPTFLLDPIGVVRRRWFLMTVGAVLGLAITAAATLFWKPVYRARATVLLSSQQIREDLVRATVRDDSISNINAMLGEVLSARNLSLLIHRLDLYAESSDERTAMELVGEMRTHIEVAPESSVSSGRRGQTSLVYGLAFDAHDSQQAADVANALAGLFVEASVARRNQLARRATEFLKRELESDERELREQSGRASEFRRSHRGTLPSELDQNLRKLDMLSERRSGLMAQIGEKNNRITTLMAMPEDLHKSDDEVMLDDLRRRLGQQTAVHTREHPNVAALERRIANLEETIAQAPPKGVGSRSAQVGAERRGLELLRSQLSETEAAITILDGQIDRTPIVAEQLATLEQKERVLEEDYVATLRKVEEAELAESLETAQQGAQVSVLDTAQPPVSAKLPRWMIAGAGVPVSLALALALAMLAEVVDPVVLKERQLEEAVDLPSLGSLPRMV